DTLFACLGGAVASMTQCPAGCKHNPPGVPDACNPAPSIGGKVGGPRAPYSSVAARGCSASPGETPANVTVALGVLPSWPQFQLRRSGAEMTAFRSPPIVLPGSMSALDP